MEYRSGVTRGLHPGMDIFPDLSPRAKPYCGVKCSQGLHIPATIVYLKAGQENCVTGPLRNMLSKIYISRNKCHLNNIKYLKTLCRPQCNARLNGGFVDHETPKFCIGI